MRRQGVILGIAIAILAVTLWRLTQPALSRDLLLTQVTFDSGVTTSPAIAADGRMLAYASDRDTSANLELYVQQIPGGTPRRLTTSSTDQSEPSFSPNGDTLVYTSSGNGGGIYAVPIAGGEPRLLAAGGRTPRYSPDGRWIVYWKGDDTVSSAFILPASGGSPRAFHPEFPMVRSPCWSPDSQSLIFWGHPNGATGDLWVAPIESGTPASTGLVERMDSAHLDAGPLDDASWTSAGFLFSARTGFVRNLYRAPVSSHGKAAGEVMRLTNGTGLMGDPAALHDGPIVFTSGNERFDIWGLPLDTRTGKSSGPPYRITSTLAPTANPDISKDGSRLLFGSSRNGYTQVWEKDLISGKEWVAATGPQGASYGRFLRQTGQILYTRLAGNHYDTFLGDRKIAAGTRPWDAYEGTVLVGDLNIEALDLASGLRKPVVRAPMHTVLSQASYSPDGRWILFLARSGARSARIYLAPAQGGEWQPLTAGDSFPDKPRFSPDGGLVYFTLDHDGNRTIQAIRIDPRSGGAAGQPFAVFEPRGPHFSLQNVSANALEISVARDKLITIVCERTTSIWMASLVPIKD